MANDRAQPGEKLLVVDDAPQNVKLLRLILKGENYQVVEAYSGPEALEKLGREHPAAMILDVRMPGMTGYEVCRRVREDPEFATLPVIMVTALSMPEERIKGIEAGATDFITKPFNKRELLARIRSSLALAKAERSPVVPQLPGFVIITDLSWRLLCLSPAAAEFLHLEGAHIMGADLRQWAGDELPTSLEASGPNVRLRGEGGMERWARQATVTDPSGVPALRLLVAGPEITVTPPEPSQ